MPPLHPKAIEKEFANTNVHRAGFVGNAVFSGATQFESVPLGVGVVKVSDDDTSEKTLIDKIISGNNNTSVTVTTSSGEEKLVITSQVFRVSFTNSNLVAGVLTVSHNLGAKYNFVQVYDNTDTQIVPDDIIAVDTNTLQVSLVSFGAIAGTWQVVVKA